MQRKVGTGWWPRLCAWAAAGIALAGIAHAQHGCPVSQDLVARALELVSATPARDDLENGLMLLKQAEEACDENGDAWYYRSLYERKLGRGNPQYSLGKARERNSAALKAAEDPFTLATPARGVQAAPREEPGAAASPHIAHDIRKPDVNQKWALVIGIARFRNPRLNLKFTRDDAQAMADLLRNPVYGRFRPDHVRLIADADATSVNIRAGVNWLARSATENDLAVIYIATHGTAREQDIEGVNYLVTYDTDVDSLDGLYSTAIRMVDITTAVRTRISALKVAVILDTCHSEGAVAHTVTIPQSISEQTLDRLKEGTGRVILAASRTEESSYESPRLGHGLFTYYLLQGLKEQKDAPLNAVYQYVQAQVTREASANGWKQHPVFIASDDVGAVVLGVAPSAAARSLPPLLPQLAVKQ